MKVLAVVLILTALWVVLAAVLGGCATRQAGDRGPQREAWLWETMDDCVGRIGGTTLPPSHPLARLGPPASPPAG
jgi:hypothetical protein